jgi:hypothetical protein
MPIGAQFVVEIFSVDEDVAKVKVWKLILFGSVIDSGTQSMMVSMAGRKWLRSMTFAAVNRTPMSL